ncbi:hypothetical protein CFIO01_01655 [Colletotrichum fioriniae PJ7]|uniref:GPI inositol-deacylase winged helix domain-containing protein n=1 Tax=Colletotrichum fioriniae PJ7 TaxID=1445577 RepID=A0A010REW0_9PEZI|nr:hypothetical protein CFIO01_01655 [Colletotrichum fioriniae PJ7]
MRIEAHDEDVRLYTRNNLTEIQSIVENTPGLESQIVNRVASSASGIFLLAKIYVDSLQKATSERQILDALEKFRLDRSFGGDHLYDDVYDDIMRKIDDQTPQHKGLARKVISWITHTNRRLKVVELQDALAVDLESPQLDRQSIPDVDMILFVCAGLVTTEKNGEIITLVHHTAYEYFQRRKGRHFPGDHGYMASICIKYLVLATQARPQPTLLDWKYPFFLHAVSEWGLHAAQTSPLQFDVIEFLEDNSLLQSLSRNVLTGYPSSGAELAAMYGILEAIEYLYRRGHEIDLPSLQGRTPLYYASAGGHHKAVEYLLKLGANASRPSEETPLHAAVRGGYPDIVSLLLNHGAHTQLEYGAYIEGYGRYGTDETPLVTATKLGHMDIVEALLLKGAFIDARSDFHHHRTPLAFAAAQGRADLVSLLLEHGASVNVLDEEACTPLAIAIRESHIPVVELLLEKRPEARLDTLDDNGQSPLSYAAMRGDLDLVKLLSDRGALVDFPTEEGLTPLSTACRYGQYAAADFLIQRNASVYVQDTNGRTPLSWACEVKAASAGLIELLLDHGAEIESHDKHGRTPLSYACSASSGIRIAEVLIRRSARVNATDALGRSPLSWACQSGVASPELVILLLDHGADIEAWDSYQRTPLLHAVSAYSQPDIVELLADRGASLQVRDSFGVTPLGAASHREHQDVAELLKRRKVQSQA